MNTFTARLIREILAVMALIAISTSIDHAAPTSATSQVSVATATFIGTDTVSEGNWEGTCGADGYSIPNSTQALPSYAVFSPLNQTNYTWAANTTDPRATETNTGGRIAATWYSNTSFSLDINLTDGNIHQVALYALDWDTYLGGRSETLQVVDAASNTVLDTRSISSFTNGIYLVWNLSGHVRVNVVTNTGNAVLSGIFFGGNLPASSTPGAATFVGFDTATQGNWEGKYGADGYSIPNSTQALPSYAVFSPLNQTNYTWAANTTDPRATETNTGGRIAATWYSNTSFSLDINLTDGNIHQIALYALDWDTYLGGRSETLQVVDAASNTVLDTRSISSFTNGIYLVWNLSGHVRVNVVTNTGNAVLSGIFFGSSAATSGTPAAASFIGFDPATQGDWEGKYGADGYSIPNSTQALPSYAVFSPLNQTNYTWAANTTDPRATETNTGGRIAATWYSNTSFSLDINLTDGNIHQIALYALDWDVYLGGRSETLQVVDAASNTVLDTRSISSFTNGIYLVWNLSGHVRVNVVTNTGNAVVSGIFFGGSTVSTQSGQGQVCVNPAAINFGNVNIGTAGSQQATILNCGSSVLSLLNISASGNGYSIVNPSLPVALPSGQSMIVAVAFQPSATGSSSGALTIVGGLPSGSTTVNLSATGVGFAPVITSQPVGQTVTASQSATFSVADTGTSPMTYQWRKNGAAISGANSSTYTTPATAAADNGSQFTVLISNCVGSTVSNPAVLTVATPTYVLSVSPSTLSFGNVNVSSTASQSVTALNSGTGDVTLSGLTASGAGFNASGIASGTVLAPGQTASFAVTFSPAVSGSVIGTVMVGSNATSGGKVISVSGTGTTPSTYSVVLSWSASSSVVVGYNVYVSTVSGTGYSKLTASPVSAISYVDGDLTVAQTRYYVVTSVDSTGTESAFSSQVSANIP